MFVYERCSDRQLVTRPYGGIVFSVIQISPWCSKQVCRKVSEAAALLTQKIGQVFILPGSTTVQNWVLEMIL